MLDSMGATRGEEEPGICLFQIFEKIIRKGNTPSTRINKNIFLTYFP
jgi:hypothetical protein